MSVAVIKPGLLTSIQDLGRPGHAALGVGRAGAMDPVALRLANALVGNPVNTAALEISLIGPTLQFHRAAQIAITGAPLSASLDGRTLRHWCAQDVPAGGVLQLGAMPRGARSYLAIRAGFDLAAVLGSLSTDLHGGIGPWHARALRAGDALPLAVDALADRSDLQRGRPDATWSLDPSSWFDTDEQPVLRLLPGAHFAELDTASKSQLLETAFRIGVDSDRVGVRLDGASLHLAVPRELCSSGVAPGTVQLPPGGQPIVLMAESPTTGGYPRIAHVIAVDQPRLAQRRPGDTVRFTLTDLPGAHEALVRREQALVRLEAEILRRRTERHAQHRSEL
ncbi:MAG: biotin-dependent carboxyltransferase family protein [Tahibacter sp.]